MQIHGGMGYTRELPIERWYRQVRLFRIFEGTDEMLRLIISRDLLRGYTKIGGHLRMTHACPWPPSWPRAPAAIRTRSPSSTATSASRYARLWARGPGATRPALQQLGVRPGDAVALLIPNVVDFPRAYYGALGGRRGRGAGAPAAHRGRGRVRPVGQPGQAAGLAHRDLAVGAAAGAAGRRPASVTVGPLPDGVAPVGRGRLEDVAAGDPLPTYVTR